MIIFHKRMLAWIFHVLLGSSQDIKYYKCHAFLNDVIQNRVIQYGVVPCTGNHSYFIMFLKWDSSGEALSEIIRYHKYIL